MRYTITVFDRAGVPLAHHDADTRDEACEVAAILRRRHPQLSVVITDTERDGQVVDEDDDTT
jgi:hypothetical protein